MTDTVIKPPRAKRLKGATKEAPPNGYVVLHSTRLALCLAAGGLAGRLYDEVPEQPLALVSGPISSAQIAGAREGTGHGVVALIEFVLGTSGDRPSNLPTELPTVLENPVAIGAATRVIFQSNSDKAEFLARIGGYGDVPADAIPFEVEPRLFEAATVDLFQGGEANPSPEPLPRLGLTGGHRLRNVDKLGGALATSLAILREMPACSVMGAAFATACTGNGEGFASADFVSSLSGTIDAGADARNGNLIAGIAASILSKQDPAGGFDPDSFLAMLIAHAHGQEMEAVTAKFVHGAADVLAGRRELSDDAFVDATGKIALRGLLLFLLNPDPVRLQTGRKRLAPVGAGVLLLASALAGCLVGFANLNVAIKAPLPSTYRALSLLACQLASGGQSYPTFSMTWSPDGSRAMSLGFAGFALWTTSEPPPDSLDSLQRILTQRSIVSAYCTTSGELIWEESESGHTGPFRARTATSPVFPKAPTVDFCLRSQPLASKEIARIVAQVNASSRATGLFAKPLLAGKSRHVELSVACLAAHVSADAVAQATLALAALGTAALLPRT